MILQRLYIDSPRWLKKMAGLCFYVVPREYLYGKAFRQIRKFLDTSQYWSIEEIRAYHTQKLKELLIYAYDNVPYYRKILDQVKVDPRKFESLEMMQQIPYLDKEIIRKNFDQLQSRSFPKSRRSYVTTGGTSGRPFGFYIDKARSVIEWAFLTKMWERIGFTLQSKRAVFRGEPVKGKQDIYWFEDSLLNQISFSSFHMSDENLAQYIKIMNEYKPAFLHGFPSALVTLAKFVKRKSPLIKFKIKGIIAISENVYHHQRELLEEVFQARFFSFFGHSEKLILAGECEHSSYYHCDPFYGYAEIINKNGEPVTKDDEVGELVGTGFINHCMPFIRYRTGDICVVSEKRCRCNRNYQLIKSIEGRWIQEMFVTRKGTYISMTALNVHSDIFDQVEQFRFEQFEPGKAILNVVPTPQFSAIDERKILDTLHRKVDEQLEFHIKKVKRLESTPGGKFIFLRQHLKIDDFFQKAS